MNTEKVTVVETIYTQTQQRVENIPSDSGIHITANVTEQNGTITAIDSINVTDAESGDQLWSGYANPAISGSFNASGRELEVITSLTDFISAIRE